MEKQYERFMINGIDGAIGETLLPPLSPDELAQYLYYERLDRQTPHFNDLERKCSPSFKYRCSCNALISNNLATTGWGIIFASDCDPAIYAALAPLRELRRQQATTTHPTYYREYYGDDGYHKGENAADFLHRHGVAGVATHPSSGMPYYLLIVGDTATIPAHFEQHLNVHYATGRVAFATAAEYATYAQSVVAAETGHAPMYHQAACFSPYQADDPLTTRTSHMLLYPLASHLASQHPLWHIQMQTAAEATTTHFAALLGEKPRPDLLIAAAHSVAFPSGHSEQHDHQGALISQEWNGPLQWIVPIAASEFFSGTTLAQNDQATIHGMIALLLGSFTLATPATERFPIEHIVGYADLAPTPFIANLPRQMLTHARGGALAVVGHNERAWSYGLPAATIRPYHAALIQVVAHLMNGIPVGAALEPIRECYAIYALALTNELEKIAMGKQPDALELVAMWAMMSDCRSLAIFGDPATRLPVERGIPDRQAHELDHADDQILPTAVSHADMPQAATPIMFTSRMLLRQDEDTLGEKGNIADKPPFVLGTVPEIIPTTRQESPPQLATLELAPDNRVINAWIANHPENIPLQVGKPYELKFRVDTPRMDAQARSEPIISLIEEMPTQERFVEIRVDLETEDFTIYGEKRQTIVVPRMGMSKNTTTFTIEATQPGEKTISALFMAKGRLFQKMTITLTVDEGDTTEPDSESMAAITTRTCGIALDSVIALPPQKMLNDFNLTILKRNTGYQFLLQNGGVTRAQIHLEEQQINEMVTYARREFNDITYTLWQGRRIYMEQDTNIPPEVHLSSLKKLANLGYYLYQRLFFSNLNDSSAYAMGTFLRELSQKHRLNLEIVAEQFVFPWVLLYDRDPLDLNAVDPEGFWGFKHIIEYMPEFRSPTLVNFVPQIPINGQVGLGFIFNKILDRDMSYPVVQNQLDFLKGLPNVTMSEHPYREDLFRLLQNADAPEQLLYFYCDAESYLPGENDGVDSSKLILSDGSVRLDELFTRAPTHQPALKNAPLVFLNACKSASMSPYLYHGLVPYLLNRGVRGVIGTEVDTPAFFGAEFAQTFIKRFVAGGKPLGELLLDMRREYLIEKHNIMGLLYALHSSAEIVIHHGHHEQT
jgi:hypothetical protein